jgi:hypothetical protein
MLPSSPWSQNDSLPDPGFRGRAADASYDAISVCEQRNFERGGRVEVLAQKEIAMIEGYRMDFDDEVVGTWARCWHIMD